VQDVQDLGLLFCGTGSLCGGYFGGLCLNHDIVLSPFFYLVYPLKKSPSALSTGYANPATRYFVSDLKKVKNQLLTLVITFPTKNQL
jgi:hypothetical protein